MIDDYTQRELAIMVMVDLGDVAIEDCAALVARVLQDPDDDTRVSSLCARTVVRAIRTQYQYADADIAKHSWDNLTRVIALIRAAGL
jgi:hypothetical protein